MSYFLAKTDPETYSITQLEKERETNWDGVHNPQAVAAIKAWQVNDLVLVYHSGKETKLMGVMEVTGPAVPDPRDSTKRSWYAPVKFVRKFTEKEQISLSDIKNSGLFQDFALVRQGRLSTMACPENFIMWLRAQGVNLP